MVFIILLVLSALTISATAGYFSIYGLASIFTSSFWSIVIMGSSLEVGKLIAASYVYRFWYKINFLMKSYLISAILVLMFITSIGIFGFLSASYQQDSIPLKEMTGLVEEYKADRVILLARKKQIADDIASLPNNFIRGRKTLIAEYKPESDKIESRLDQLRLDLTDIQKKKVSQESHTGPIIYIAKVMGREVDDAILYMILMIIFAFDPLAIVLVLATNSAIADRRKTLDIKKAEAKLEPIIDEVIHEIEEELENVEDAIEEAIEEVEEFIETPEPIQGYDSLDNPTQPELAPELKTAIDGVVSRKNVMRSIRKV